MEVQKCSFYCGIVGFFRDWTIIYSAVWMLLKAKGTHWPTDPHSGAVKSGRKALCKYHVFPVEILAAPTSANGLLHLNNQRRGFAFRNIPISLLRLAFQSCSRWEAKTWEAQTERSEMQRKTNTGKASNLSGATPWIVLLETRESHTIIT